MKRNAALLLGALGALGAAACAPNTSIQIQYAIGDQPSATAGCSVSDSTLQRGGGSVDLANTSHYMAALHIVSSLDSADLKAGGETVNPATRNDFKIDTLILGYSAQGLSIPDQKVGSSGLVPAGGTLALGLDLLTGPAVSKLFAFARDTPKTVTVSVKLAGKFVSGSSHETETFDFPLTVYLGTTLNCNGYAVIGAPTGTSPPACMNWGQDGIRGECQCDACAEQCTSTQTCDTQACLCVAK